MIDDRVAHRATAAGDDLQVLGGQAALFDQHLRERNAAERCLARRLEDDGATGGDRRGDLVHDEVERKIERCDGADNTDRHSQREAQLAFACRNRIERDHLTTELACLGGSELKRADGTLGLDTRGLDRLRGLLGDDQRKLLAAGREACRGSIENRGAFPQRQRVVVQRVLGHGHGAVDVGSAL